MKNIKIYFLKNIKSLVIIAISIFSFFVLFKDNDELLDKLNNNKELIKKYNEFKKIGVSKSIIFPKIIIENVIDTALSYIGTPNRIGGINKDGIDASALVYISIKKNSEIEFPRIAQEMARNGEVIYNPKKLRRADLVFFFDTYEVNRIITSVGIYLGDGNFIHSSSSKGVTVSDINDPYYWKDKFFYGTRIFK